MKLLRGCVLGVALLWVAPCVLAQATISQILTNGPTNKRINIVFLSEGYLPSEADLFTYDAFVALENILLTPPFDTYGSYFNAFAIFVSSAESGSDHPSRGQYRNTYFNSTFDSYGITRLTTIPPNDRDGSYANGKGKVDALLQDLMPEYDISVLIINDTEYGGSGGSPLMTSVNYYAPEIAVHELGHNFSALGDEYDSAYPGYPDIEEPNTTRETNPALIKWRDWLLPGTPIPTPETSFYSAMVGLFEGAHYHTTGWYRPKRDCKMNHLGVPFCEVCSEALVKSTYGLVRPIESNSPPTNTVISLFDTQVASLMVTRPQPNGYDLQVQWFTNCVAVTGATNGTFTISASALPAGENQVHVEVADPTAKVRTDPLQILKDRRIWSLTVQPRPALEARRSQNSILLSWPVSAAGFVLESRTNVSLGTSWDPVVTPPAMVGDRFTVTNPTSGETRYFRLRQ